MRISQELFQIGRLWVRPSGGEHFLLSGLTYSIESDR
jgi:hypothetical protein